MGRKGRRYEGYPVGLPSLPYTCDDPGCECHVAEETEVQHVRLIRRLDEWIAKVSEDGLIKDEFRGHDVNELLGEIHRAFPRAQFNPERGI